MGAAGAMLKAGVFMVSWLAWVAFAAGQVSIPQANVKMSALGECFTALEKIKNQSPLLKAAAQVHSVGDLSKVTIKCADGYQPVADQALINEAGWVLAFSENGQSPLKPFRYAGKNISPGPFYLVGDRARSYLRFGWPYQVTSFEGS